MLNKVFVQRLLHKAGWHLSRYSVNSSALCRRKALIAHNQIDLVLDVGGNVGQYVEELRFDLGYNNKIYSFEPVNSAFEVLKSRWQYDKNWTGVNLALGDTEGSSKINIAANLHSSSIMPMLKILEEYDPESRYISSQEIRISTLDSWISGRELDKNNILLKIDVQGYEPKVLAGSLQSLDRIRMIQMELSLTRLYSDEMTLRPMLELMESLGFRLASLDSGFADQTTGELVQIDGIFINEKIKLRV